MELERQRLVPIFPKLKMQFRRSEFAVLCASNYFVYMIHPLTQSPLQVCNTTQGELRNKKTFSCNSLSPPKRILIFFFQSHSGLISDKIPPTTYHPSPYLSVPLVCKLPPSPISSAIARRFQDVASKKTGVLPKGP